MILTHLDELVALEIDLKGVVVHVAHDAPLVLLQHDAVVLGRAPALRERKADQRFLGYTFSPRTSTYTPPFGPTRGVYALPLYVIFAEGGLPRNARPPVAVVLSLYATLIIL